ncbi:hypothetical protein EV401DRAFT_1892979 [Pisolithus croceorrhizus]|nr:hypothetical protein EV401DRAFT_1892979 [Pisolithus croceorrhizus]
MKHSFPLFLGHAPPSRSTVPHSRALTFQGSRHLDHRHYTAVSGYGSATVDARGSQCLKPSTGDDYAVSVSEALQLPGRPIIPTPLLARSSDLTRYLCRESGSAQVALSLGYVAGQDRVSSIIKDAPSVDHTRDYWVTQSYPSNYITNHNTTLPPSYTNPLPPYAVEQLSGYPQDSGNVSTFGDLGSSFAGPTTGLGPILSLHDRTSGQVISSDAPWSRLSNPLVPSFQELYPSDDFVIGNIPSLPKQFQTEIERISRWTPSSYTYPIPCQSDSTAYSTSEGYISSCPSFPMPNQNSSSWFPQEHLGYPIPTLPHRARPVDLPGSHEFDTGSKMELPASGILNDHAGQALGEHPSDTLSNHKTHPFCDYATYISHDHTAGDRVEDYGIFDESTFNSEQVVGPRPQLPLPPNQLPLSPFHELHSHDHSSGIEGGSPSRIFCHTCHSATAWSRFPTRLLKAQSDDEGGECEHSILCSNYLPLVSFRATKDGQTQKLFEAREGSAFGLPTLGEWGLGPVYYWNFWTLDQQHMSIYHILLLPATVVMLRGIEGIVTAQHASQYKFNSSNEPPTYFWYLVTMHAQRPKKRACHIFFLALIGCDASPGTACVDTCAAITPTPQRIIPTRMLCAWMLFNPGLARILQVSVPGTSRIQLASYSPAVLAANTQLGEVWSRGCIAKRMLGADHTKFHVHHLNRTHRLTRFNVHSQCSSSITTASFHSPTSIASIVRRGTKSVLSEYNHEIARLQNHLPVDEEANEPVGRRLPLKIEVLMARSMPRNDLDRTTMALPIVSSTPCNITKSRHVKTSGRRQVVVTYEQIAKRASHWPHDAIPAGLTDTPSPPRCLTSSKDPRSGLRGVRRVKPTPATVISPRLLMSSAHKGTELRARLYDDRLMTHRWHSHR